MRMRLSLRQLPCFKQSRLLAPLRTITRHNVRRCITTSATNPAQVQHAQVQLPRIIISPGSQHHNSLPSFLEYASRVNLEPTKTVYVGTHYEYTAALSLLRLGFSLLRTGRKSDAGIDLIGHWILPPLRAPFPVIVQCKARKGESCAPRHIRELEGAFQGIPSEWRKKSVLGLLVTTQKATRGVLEALGTSNRPMGFMKVSRNGTIEQFLWNKAAGEQGLEGVGVTVRHTPKALLKEGVTEQGEEGSHWEVPAQRSRKKQNKYRESGMKKDIVLTWMGNPIFPERKQLSEETLRLVGEMGIGSEAEKDVKVKKKRKITAAVKRGATRKTAGKSTSSPKKSPLSSPAGEIGADAGKGTEAGPEVKRGRGRPPGSKNKKTLELLALAVNTPRKRGRPKGTKNKSTTTPRPVPVP